MDNISIVCQVFMAIKYNWSKNGSCQSLVENICQRLNIPFNEEICANLKKSGALWLNNHLEEPLEETQEEKAEINDAKSSEEIKKFTHLNAQKKNHDYH